MTTSTALSTSDDTSKARKSTWQATAMLWRLTRGQRWRYLAALLALVVSILFAYGPPLVVKATIDGVLSQASAAESLQAASDAAAPRQLSDEAPGVGGRAIGAQAANDQPGMLQRWVEQAVGDDPDAVAGQLWKPGVLVLLLTALAGVFHWLRGRWAALASETITARLREQLYDHLQHLPCRFFDQASTGDLVQRCTSDVETIRLFMSTQIVELSRAVVMIAAVLPIMLALDWRMTAAATVLLPVILGFAIVFFVMVKHSFEAMDEAEGALSNAIQENLTGIRVVRAFARQDFEHGKFAKRNDDHRGKHLRHYIRMGSYWALSDLLVFAQMGLVLFAGAYWVKVGEAGGGVSVGTLVAFWSYVTLYIWPVRQMGRILADSGKAVVAAQRVQHILGEEEEEPRKADAMAESSGDQADGTTAAPGAMTAPSPTAPALPARLSGELILDNVSFSHSEQAPVLHDISFALQPGETLAILGPSGCGKSTLVNLLLRFYPYDAGSIRLDGHELRSLPRKYVRGQIASVMQEPFLYSKTLADNIRLGETASQQGRHDRSSEPMDDEAMIEAAMTASIHESIISFDDGYGTLVGERGVTLSGGQRQRVAIARALMRQSPIMILDDAFSAVDTRTETMILDALRDRHGRQTTLLIAHRISTLMQADRVLVLEQGRVADLGTHDELIARPGLYQNLWNLQHAESARLLRGA